MGDSTVLLDYRSGEYFRLNDTAASIWRILEVSQELSDIVAQVAAEYEAPDEPDLTKECQGLVYGLCEAGLLIYDKE